MGVLFFFIFLDKFLGKFQATNLINHAFNILDEVSLLFLAPNENVGQLEVITCIKPRTHGNNRQTCMHKKYRARNVRIKYNINFNYSVAN